MGPLFRRVRALVLDVDGVLTDGSEYWGRWGERLKRFNTLDGKGIERLLKAGIRVFVISGEDSPISRRYTKCHGIREASLGVVDKCKVLRDLARKHRLPLESLAYMGDDAVDLPCMKVVGLPIAVPNAVPEVREAARYATTANGGTGAVREVADLILRAAAGGSVPMRSSIRRSALGISGALKRAPARSRNPARPLRRRGGEPPSP